jgi:hypothetical protein
MSPLTWEVRFLTLPAWLGLGARPSLKIDRATIKHFESREPISPERRIGWASISIARFFPMAHLPDGGQPWETKSSSAVSTSGACLANAKNQLTLSIMNRSVQYAISRDSIQGGGELIGSLRDNGDMGRPKNFGRERALEKTLLRNVHPARRHLRIEPPGSISSCECRPGSLYTEPCGSPEHIAKRTVSSSHH